MLFLQSSPSAGRRIHNEWSIENTNRDVRCFKALTSNFQRQDASTSFNTPTPDLLHLDLRIRYESAIRRCHLTNTRLALYSPLPIQVVTRTYTRMHELIRTQTRSTQKQTCVLLRNSCTCVCEGIGVWCGISFVCCIKVACRQLGKARSVHVCSTSGVLWSYAVRGPIILSCWATSCLAMAWLIHQPSSSSIVGSKCFTTGAI